jgi:hypothetical protein
VEVGTDENVGKRLEGRAALLVEGGGGENGLLTSIIRPYPTRPDPNRPDPTSDIRVTLHHHVRACISQVLL